MGNKGDNVSKGQLRWDGGVSTAVDADILPENQVARMKNVLITDGKPKPRWALRERLLIPQGNIQGAKIYEARGKIMLSINGRLYRVSVSGNKFETDEVPLNQKNSAVAKKCWMQETPSGFLIQDGQSQCIIYDGSRARRSNPANFDVPRGTCMAYGNGRLAVAVTDGVTVGDVYKQYSNGSELKFSEDSWWYLGGSIAMPSTPLGMKFLPLNDTSTGAGALMVIGKDWTQSIGLDNRARDTWQNDENFVTLVFPNLGGVSDTSMVVVNQDIWWRSQNGELRSLRYAALDQESAGHTSQSKEMTELMSVASASNLINCSGIYFKDQLLMTGKPYINIHGGISYKSLLSLNFSPMSNMRGKAEPAFNGQWEGINPVYIFKGRISGSERAFVVSTDDDGHNRLWEYMPKEWHDSSYLLNTDNITSTLRNNRIKWQIESRKFFHGSINRMDDLMTMDIYVSKIREDVDIKVYYRPDYWKQWELWDTISFNAEVGSTTGPQNVEAQGRSDVGLLRMSENKYNASEKRWANRGYGFQFKFEIDGYAQIDRFITGVTELDESEGAERESVRTTSYLHVVTNNEVTHSIPVGGIEYMKDEDGFIIYDERGVGIGERTITSQSSIPVGNGDPADPYRLTPEEVLSLL